MEDSAFGLEPVSILFATVDGSLLLAYWLPRLVFQRPPSVSALLIPFVMLGSLLFPGIFCGLGPLDLLAQTGIAPGSGERRGA